MSALSESFLRPADRLTARLDHLALESKDPLALATFYQDVLGYRIELAGDEIHAVAEGRRLVFLPGRSRRLAYGAFAVADRNALSRLTHRVEAAGRSVEPFASRLFEAGAVVVADPDRGRWAFGVPSERPVSDLKAGAPPARLQHVVMASLNPGPVIEFFEVALGFTASDNVFDEEGGLRTTFLRCSHEHHSFAVFKADAVRLDHHCYETPDWGAIRDWGDHVAARRIKVQWGPGRHGPGNNLFLFIHDPDGNWVELSAELETVEHTRPLGAWPHDERTLNSWGQGLLRS